MPEVFVGSSEEGFSGFWYVFILSNRSMVLIEGIDFDDDLRRSKPKEAFCFYW
jgi:hypothetical protein